MALWIGVQGAFCGSKATGVEQCIDGIAGMKGMNKKKPGAGYATGQEVTVTVETINQLCHLSKS